MRPSIIPIQEHTRRNGRNAMSLVDVTAGVTAVGLLAFCFLPSAALVARNSKNARCLSHLARIGYANAIYAAQDPNDAAMPVHWKQYYQCPGVPPGQMCNAPIYVGAYEWGGKSGIGRDDFLTGTPGDPLNSKFGTKAGFGPAARPLNGVIYKEPFADHLNPEFDPQGATKDTQLDLEVYRCPSDTGYTGIHCPWFAESGDTSYDHFGTSYTANIFMTASSGGGQMQSNSPYLHRMSELLDPKRTLAYQENNGRFAWMAAPESWFCRQNLGLEGIPGIVRGWHGKDWTFNSAFVDGHADTIYMRGYRSELVFPDDGGQQGQYQCIIIRGEGWQKDTLPAPLIPTQLWYGGEGRPSYEDCFESASSACSETAAEGTR